MSKKKPDWSDAPGFREYAKHVIDDMVPAMRDSALVMTIAPLADDAADVKQAVEIGYAILLDKPLVVVVPPGRHMGEKLLRIADHVITADVTTEAGREQLGVALNRLMNQ